MSIDTSRVVRKSGSQLPCATTILDKGIKLTKIILAGNAITAEIILAYLRQDTRYHVVATTVDDDFVISGTVKGIPSIGLSDLKSTFPSDEASIVMAMGYDNLNRNRQSMFARLKSLGYSIETYVHPDANVYSEHPIGEGSVILPSAVVEPRVRIGANTMVWCNVTLAHHSSVAENCWIASGAVISGQATISHNTFVGVNATIVNGITVGEDNVIGAGALITKTTQANSVHLARSAEQWRYSAEDYAKYFGV